MSKRIRLQLLCLADHLPDVVEPLQRIITVLVRASPGADDLSFVGDVDAGILVHADPAEHGLIKKKEAMELGVDIAAVAKSDPVVAYLGLQLEGLRGRNIDLGDLGHPE